MTYRTSLSHSPQKHPRNLVNPFRLHSRAHPSANSFFRVLPRVREFAPQGVAQGVRGVRGDDQHLMRIDHPQTGLGTTSNRCLTSRNKKLLETSALLVVTKSY